MSDLQSVSSGIQVPSSTHSFVVSSAPSGDGFTRVLDFNGGTVGASAKGSGGGTFDDGANLSTYSNEEVFEGGMACRIATQEAVGNTPNFGGYIKFKNTPVEKGGEIWTRIRTFIPHSFDKTAKPGLKFIRHHALDSNGDNAFYNDVYMNNSSSQPFYFQIEMNLGDTKTVMPANSSDAPVKGVWETYESYVAVDNVAKDDGGKACHRFWKNGVLLGEITDKKSLNKATHSIQEVLIFTYWNDDSQPRVLPPAQHMFIDNIIVTSQIPSKTDAFGNRYLGV